MNTSFISSQESASTPLRPYKLEMTSTNSDVLTDEALVVTLHICRIADLLTYLEHDRLEQPLLTSRLPASLTAIALRYMLRSLGVPVTKPTTMMGDNMGVIQNASNPDDQGSRTQNSIHPIVCSCSCSCSCSCCCSSTERTPPLITLLPPPSKS